MTLDFTQKREEPVLLPAAAPEFGTPVDRWIRWELRRSFDQTLAEALPDELLHLLESSVAVEQVHR